ncbi:MAG: acyl-CoA desaturase [Bacteroidota bacterium]
MATVHFSRPNSDFFATLRKSVEQYFSENKLDSSGNSHLYWKATILITTYIACYLTIMLLPIPMWLGAILALFLGFIQALVGFNIMHDACHEAFSDDKRINYFFGLSMNALGSDAFMWRQKHNVIHHTYTNIDGVDDDIAKSPLLRMSETQPRFKAHRFQHIYLTFLYAISTIFWVLLKDFQHYFMGHGYAVEVGKMKLIDHLMFWTTKVIYMGLYVVLPIMVWGVWPAIVGFVLMHAMLGSVMSFVFQLAHVVENVEFEHHHGESTQIDAEWAVYQIATTSDFAPRNKVVSWFLGGLNFQVEHHLFPRISHVHYPAIQQIVAKICADYGVEYRYYPTMNAALASHFRHMKHLGQMDHPTPIVS